MLGINVSVMDSMLDICYRYSCKWRYFFNDSKCAVLVVKRQENLLNDIVFHIGSAPIQLTSDQVHLGIDCYSYLPSKNQLYDASVKLRSTFIRVTNNGLQAKHIYPLLLRTIYVGNLVRRRMTSPRTFTLLLRHVYIIAIVVTSVRGK